MDLASKGWNFTKNLLSGQNICYWEFFKPFWQIDKSVSMEASTFILLSADDNKMLDKLLNLSGSHPEKLILLENIMKKVILSTNVTPQVSQAVWIHVGYGGVKEKQMIRIGRERGPHTLQPPYPPQQQRMILNHLQ